jgi:plasmid stability protein
MPVTLSIENAPGHVVQCLRARAVQHRRSLHNELMAIIDAAAGERCRAATTEMLAVLRRLGLHTSREAAAIVRADRDAAA